MTDQTPCKRTTRKRWILSCLMVILITFLAVFTVLCFGQLEVEAVVAPKEDLASTSMPAFGPEPATAFVFDRILNLECRMFILPAIFVLLILISGIVALVLYQKQLSIAAEEIQANKAMILESQQQATAKIADAHKAMVRLMAGLWIGSVIYILLTFFRVAKECYENGKSFHFFVFSFLSLLIFLQPFVYLFSMVANTLRRTARNLFKKSDSACVRALLKAIMFVLLLVQTLLKILCIPAIYYYHGLRPLENNPVKKEFEEELGRYKTIYYDQKVNATEGLVDA